MTKPRRRTDMKKEKKSVRITPADRRRSVETIAREAERQSILADAAFLFACSTKEPSWPIVQAIMREMSVQSRYVRDQAAALQGKNVAH